VPAKRSYIPGRYPNDRLHDLDLSMGWDSCAMGGVEVHVVPGDHVDMISMPQVHAVADKLAANLDGSSNHKMGRRGLTPGPYQVAIGLGHVLQ
jgi:thioesterase domain-containing protein